MGRNVATAVALMMLVSVAAGCEGTLVEDPGDQKTKKMVSSEEALKINDEVYVVITYCSASDCVVRPEERHTKHIKDGKLKGRVVFVNLTNEDHEISFESDDAIKGDNPFTVNAQETYAVILKNPNPNLPAGEEIEWKYHIKEKGGGCYTEPSPGPRVVIP